MIRRQDLTMNFYCFYVISMLGFIPVHFSMRTGKIRVLYLGSRRWLWRLWFYNGIAYSIHLVARLVQSMAFRQVVSAHHLSFHITLSCFSVVMCIWQYILFVRNPDVNESTFNMIKLADEANNCSRTKYTTQEWFILFMPMSINIVCTILGAGVYLVDWNSLQFVFSALPLNYQTNTAFTLLLIYETAIFSSYLGMVYYGLFVQLAFIQNCNDDLRDEAKFVQSNVYQGDDFRAILGMCDEGRRMELKIKLFNHIYAPMIFYYKLNLITISTALWYFSIRYFKVPFVAIPSAILAVDCTTIFLVTYDKAFMIPGRMQKYKDQVLIASKTLSVKTHRDYVKRRILSVPDVGIRVGDFHTLERTSTPRFVDFITRQTCGLLMTFRQIEATP